MFITTDEAVHAVRIATVDIVKLPEKYLLERRLYIKQGEATGWLYTDVSCTTKATINDVPNNSNFEIGEVGAGSVVRWKTPVSVLADAPAGVAGYKTVTILINKANNETEFSDYYTAEYTG